MKRTRRSFTSSAVAAGIAGLLAAPALSAEWPACPGGRRTHRRGRLHLRPAARDELRGRCMSSPSTRSPASSRRRSTKIDNMHHVATYEDTASRHAEQRHAILHTVAGSACRADGDLRAGGGEGALLFGAVDRRQHLQLRLHRQPRHGDRAGLLSGGRTRLERRERPPASRRSFPRPPRSCSPTFAPSSINPDDMPNVEKVQAGYNGAAAVGLSEAARALPAAPKIDFLPATTPGHQGQFLRLSRRRPPIRAARRQEDKAIRAKLATIGVGPGQDHSISRTFRSITKPEILARHEAGRRQGRQVCWPAETKSSTAGASVRSLATTPFTTAIG